MLNEPVNLLNPNGPNLTPPAPRRKVARYFIIGIIALLILNWGIKRYTLASWPKEPNAYDAVTLKPKKWGFLQSVKNFFFHSDNILVGQTENRINILLLGIGGIGHDGPYLSDTNIIVSINPSTRDVAMISVPRDLGVKINDHGWRKINSADAFGEAQTPGSGGEYAREIFEQTFNLLIPYYIRLDFAAFERIINAVGGVTVDIPRGFTDSQFPGPNNSYQTVSFAAGRQTLNGQQALNYVRSRHGSNGEDSDFARSRRQQLILVALKQELLSAGTLLNPIRIKQIYDSLSQHIVTNLDFGQLMYLAGLAKDLNGQVKNLVLDSSPKGFLVNTTGDNGAFILSPKTGNFDEVNAAIKNIFEPTGELAASGTPSAATPQTAAKIPSLTPGSKIEVQNGTWRVGLAARVKERLSANNLNVIGVGNSLKRPIDSTSIYALNTAADPQIIKKLEAALNAKTEATLPEWLTPSYDNQATVDNEQGMKYNSGADILVILGGDFKE